MCHEVAKGASSLVRDYAGHDGVVHLLVPRRYTTYMSSALETDQRSAEHARLDAHRRREANWKLWGPYLSERAWGTVREDYSHEGDAWRYFPHKHAPSRAYRWNEDGLAGICDRYGHLCFALALWNTRDPILKERLFGLSGPEGNHGEDVKEYYYYLDSTPTHSYMKMLYKYSHRAYPYRELVEENARRGLHDPEFELIDTGVFDENRYFDVFVEYAKASEADVLAKVTVVNRGSEAAVCHVLPTLWCRNTWSWGYPAGPMGHMPEKPQMRAKGGAEVDVQHAEVGHYVFYAEGEPELLFTDNSTNAERLFGVNNESPYVKDAFHRYLIEKDAEAVNPAHTGTKVAAHYRLELPPGASHSVRLRLTRGGTSIPFDAFEETFEARQYEADAFYQALQNPTLSEDARLVQRQALAGMLWSKQLYYYDVPQWLTGDPILPRPEEFWFSGRNSNWEHLVNFDIISMPDKWEFPWYATWDSAFHCLPLALVDADFAKRQLELFTREWYMHPNGQLPAYEWNFNDVNPPVHAWAVWRVYKIDAKQRGEADVSFLKGMFHKLLMNFTWWVNRKDVDDRNIFQGGFLGLDNIGVFDRSEPLPEGKQLDQADATAWMASYCLVMLKMALELAKTEPVYQDSASKFFEHFLRIAYAMTHLGRENHSLWNEGDGFFYDVLHRRDGSAEPLRVRSLVGLLPLFAAEVLEPGTLERMPVFTRRMTWFLENRPDISCNIVACDKPGTEGRRLLSLVTAERLQRVLAIMLDEDEFLSPYGIRSLSKYHQQHPFELKMDGRLERIAYQPAESDSYLFGGNSNWRGPIWFPMNYLIIESLQKYHHYYGEDFRVECPTGSGTWMSLGEVATELSKRLTRIFLRDGETRPLYGEVARFQEDPHWRDYLLFNEYFHGDTGKGLGANHQTGWTGLVAKLLQQSGG